MQGGTGPRQPFGDSSNSYLVNVLTISMYPGQGNTVALADIKEPANLVFIHEDQDASHRAFTRPRLDPNGFYREWINSVSGGVCNNERFGYDRWHQGGANRLFCDGYAKWSKQSAMSSRDYGLRRRSDNANVVGCDSGGVDYVRDPNVAY